jgi:serine/threonine protein kinase
MDLAIDDRDAASIVGTPGYAPPERRGSPTGDVFGLGGTLRLLSTPRLTKPVQRLLPHPFAFFPLRRTLVYEKMVPCHA